MVIRFFAFITCPRLCLPSLIASNRQSPGKSITPRAQQPRARLRIHRVQQRLPHRRAPRLGRDLRHRRRGLRPLPPLPPGVDLLQILRLPRLVAVRPSDASAARAPAAAAAGLVQLRVEGLDAVGHGFEDGGYGGVLEVEVQDGGFADEGELGGGHGHGGGGVAAEELRFEAVEVRFQVDEFGGAGAAGHLAHELVHGSAPGDFDAAAGAEDGDGPLLALAEEDLVDEVGADVAVVDGEVGLQAGVGGGEPAEEDGDELEFVDVFGRVGRVVGGSGPLGQGPVVGGTSGELEHVAVVGTVGVAVAGFVEGIVGGGREGLAAYLDVPGCGVRSCLYLDEIGAVEPFPLFGGGAVFGDGACVLSERVDWIWCWDWSDRRVGTSDASITSRR